MRICEVCGSDDFSGPNWTCKPCGTKEEFWQATGQPKPEGEEQDGPENGEGEGDGDQESEGDEGEGNGEGNGEPPPDEEVVFLPGELLILPSGGMAIVIELLGGRETFRGMRIDDPEFFLAINTSTGAQELRSIKVSEEEDRSESAILGPGSFITVKGRQEVLTDGKGQIIDGCEYQIVELETGHVRGLDAEEAKKCEKVKE